jgi:hypothetical protein
LIKNTVLSLFVLGFILSFNLEAHAIESDVTVHSDHEKRVTEQELQRSHVVLFGNQSPYFKVGDAKFGIQYGLYKRVFGEGSHTDQNNMGIVQQIDGYTTSEGVHYTGINEILFGYYDQHESKYKPGLLKEIYGYDNYPERNGSVESIKQKGGILKRLDVLESKSAQVTQSVPGKDGAPGKNGIQGPQGERGPEGKQGLQGTPGKDGVIPKEKLNQITSNRTDIDANAKTLGAHDGRITANATKLDEHGKQITSNRTDIDSNKQTLKSHSARIKTTEENLGAHDSRITANMKNIGQLQDDLVEFKSQTESRVMSLEGRTTVLEGRMSQTESKVSKLEKRMQGTAAATAALMQTANVPQKRNVLALSFGVGHHEGAKAIAIGVAGSAGLNPKVTMGYRIGVAVSPQQKGPTFGAGTTFFFE